MSVKEKKANMTIEYVEIKKMVLVLNVHIDDIEEIQETERIDRNGKEKK